MPTNSKNVEINPKRQLEIIISPFLSVELTLHAKRVMLTDASKNAIKDALKYLKIADERRLILPESTIKMAKYGPIFEEILDNQEQYLITKNVKKMSKRAGSHIFAITDWDARLIEATLKKAKNPKTKFKEDEKLFLEFKKEASGFLGNPSDLFNFLDNKFLDFQELFVSPSSLVTQNLLKGRMIFFNIKNVKQKINETKQEIENYVGVLDKLRLDQQSLEKQIIDLWQEFYKTSSGQIYERKEKELHDLIVHNPLNEYLDIIHDLVDTFLTYIEKQNVQITNENKNLLLKLKESLIQPVGNLAVEFPALIEFVLLYAEEAFGKRVKKKPQLIDKEYLVNSPGWNAWQEAHRISQELTETKSVPEFELIKRKLEQFELEKKACIAKKEEIEKKLSLARTNMNDLEANEKHLNEQIIEWIT